MNDLALLETLKELPQLTQLSLYLESKQLGDLKLMETLKELPQLTHLSLYISPSEAKVLQSLEQLNGLTHLTGLQLNLSVRGERFAAAGATSETDSTDAPFQPSRTE